MPYADRQAQLEAQRRHYKNNAEKYRARTRAQRQKRYDLINALKQRPCEDCGIEYPPPVLHFHHPSGDGNTDRWISSMIRDMAPLEKLRAEAESCILLCANCHILRHISDGTIGKTK